MPLEHVDSELVREQSGFTFSMRVAGTQQTVRVFVSDDALEGEFDLPDESELRAQLEEDLLALESVASEKYCRGHVAADGVVAITLADVMKFTE
jgi:hypothetical protein